MNRRSLIIGILIAPFARLLGKTEQQMVVTGGPIKVDNLTVAHACSCVPSVPFPAGFTLDANNRVILCPHGKAMTFTACFSNVGYGALRPWPHGLTFKAPSDAPWPIRTKDGKDA